MIHYLSFSITNSSFHKTKIGAKISKNLLLESLELMNKIFSQKRNMILNFFLTKTEIIISRKSEIVKNTAKKILHKAQEI